MVTQVVITPVRGSVPQDSSRALAEIRWFDSEWYTVTVRWDDRHTEVARIIHASDYAVG